MAAGGSEGGAGAQLPLSAAGMEEEVVVEEEEEEEEEEVYYTNVLGY